MDHSSQGHPDCVDQDASNNASHFGSFNSNSKITSKPNRGNSSSNNNNSSSSSSNSTTQGDNSIVTQLMDAYNQQHKECLKLSKLIEQKEVYIEELFRRYQENWTQLTQYKEEHHELTQHLSILLETIEQLDNEVNRSRENVKNVLSKESEMRQIDDNVQEMKTAHNAKNRQILENLILAKRRFRTSSLIGQIDSTDVINLNLLN